MCLLTNERIETYQTEFAFGRLGHAPEVGLGGTMGVLVDLYAVEISYSVELSMNRT